MSLINKMLQELDRRHAGAAPQGQARHPEVRAVQALRSGSEWFWRIVAGLMLVAAAWTMWVVYQLQPRSVATELAYRAAENTRRRAAASPAPAVPLAVAAQAKAAAGTEPVPSTGGISSQQAPQATVPAAPAATPAVVAAAPAPEKLAAPIETLRLALTIDTPLAPRSARPKDAPPPAAAATNAGGTRSARALPAAEAVSARVEKRDRAGSPVEQAEAEFRRAAQMLERGRVADAEQALLAALNAQHSHQPARQTLIALYIEQGRIDEARRQLQEGLAVNPGYAPFAVALARIHLDRREQTVALEVLDRAQSAGQTSAEFHTLRAAILQRLARHEEAAEGFRMALGIGQQAGATWVGLGISLDALGRRPEAAEAFRRGLASGALTDEVRAYAEQRARQLQ